MGIAVAISLQAEIYAILYALPIRGSQL